MTLSVVTGANRGIGMALCRHLSTRGDRVVAVCRNSSPALDQTAHRVVGGVDVTDEATIRHLASALEGEKIDVLVNNAGILGEEDLGAIDFGSLRRQFEVNALGPLRVTEALLGNLHEGAKVVMVTSRMGSIADNGTGGYYGYRMSKAALNAAAVSLAVDLRPRGISVLLVHPGYVRTDMTSGAGHQSPDEAAANIVRRIDELTLETTGRFRHANGDALPW